MVAYTSIRVNSPQILVKIKRTCKIMGNIQIEECINRLIMIYDKVEHLKDNMFYVYADDKAYIIDEYGNRLHEFEGKAIRIDKCGPGWVYEHFDGIRTRQTLFGLTENNEVNKVSDVREYKSLSDNVFVTRDDLGKSMAIYGKDFKQLTPPIYEQVYLEKESLHHLVLKVGLERYTSPDKLSYINVDKDGTKVSHFFTKNIGMQDEYQAMAVEANGMSFRYALSRGADRLTDKTFTSLTCSNRSLDRNLIETWEETYWVTYKGLINTSGKILIDTGRYYNIEETPFRDLFIVKLAKRKNKIGIYQVDKGEVIPCGTFSNVRSAVLGIIALKHVESDKEVYLGNDRNIHSEINKAFPIYRLNKLVEGEEVYMVNIYGAWNVIDKHFNLSYVGLKALGVK